MSKVMKYCHFSLQYTELTYPYLEYFVGVDTKQTQFLFARD
jgi:hypothetical protein